MRKRTRSKRVIERTIFVLAPALCTLAAATAGAADWRQFRGTDSNSVTADAPPPVDASDAEGHNIAWKASLPGRGPSSPIVVDGRVIVTSSSGPNQERLHVACFDAAAGKQLWERQFWATGRTFTHPSSANAAPTPASDGKLVFAFFSSNDLACLDLDGNLKWFRGLAHDFPHAGNDVGMASSPVVAGDVVVAQVECQGDSFAAGIDRETGETRWRIPRSREASWASPVVMRGDNPPDDVVLLQSPSGLSAHRPNTGEKLWSHDVACDGISSPAAVDGLVYVASKGMTVLRPADRGEPEIVWNAQNLQPGAASVVVGADRLYIVNRSGVLTCAGTQDGEIKWRLRLDGEFWGTGVLAGSRLYCVSQKGKIQVVQTSADGTSGEVVGSGQLDGTIQCSPAVVDGALYVRSDGHLWKIAAP
jgi:outer membrane protein assembly factor BamB